MKNIDYRNLTTHSALKGSPPNMGELLPDPLLRDSDHGLTVYRGDSLQLLKTLGNTKARFDMIFADPPYFLSNGGITCASGKRVKVDKGEWDKSRGVDLNHEFNKEWLKSCQTLLQPNGTIWISGTHHVIFSVGFALQELGFKLLNTITWEKPNPPPNLSCRYFTHSTESVIWAARDEDSKHVFNYADMRRANSGKQMKTVWRPDELSDADTDLWTIGAPRKEEKAFGKHPTQKPVRLLERCITASTNPGDSVLDPFMGGATTGVACLNTGRSFTGIELDDAHADLAVRRLKAATIKLASKVA